MKNLVKEKMEQGKQAVGTFLDLGNGTVAECLGLAGVDYFIVDTEHSPFDLPEIMECCRSAQLKGITPFVRIKEISRGSIMKALDVGAQGLIIPGVQTVEEVKTIIKYGKYVPMGNRGFCPTRCCDWGYGDAMAGGIRAYTDQCNREIMLVPQCETRECLENLEEIVNLEGVDGIFIGPFDLSVALEKAGQFDDPEMVAAFERIRTVCQKAGKPVFIFAPTLEAAKLRLSQGYDSVCYSADLNVLVEAFMAAMKELKGQG